METVIAKYETGEDDFPNTLRSGGLFPCIAVGIFDRLSHHAYLIHEPNAAIDKNLPGFCRNVLGKSRKENLKVWVTGAAIFEDDEESTYVLGNRTYAETIMSEYFEDDQLFIQWLPNNTYGELTNNTTSGEFTIIHY